MAKNAVKLVGGTVRQPPSLGQAAVARRAEKRKTRCAVSAQRHGGRTGIWWAQDGGRQTACAELSNGSYIAPRHGTHCV